MLFTGDPDFGAEDVALARRIQPLLVLLARHYDVMGRWRSATRDIPLTDRQLAVLRLLSEGHTAEAIGHRLGIATGTVHVHLDNLYRRLGVHDRMMAVHVARHAGLLETCCPAHLVTAGSDDATPPERRLSWSPVLGTGHLAGVP